VLRAAYGWLDRQPYLLLLLATLFWGGNVVAGKLVVGDVSPMATTFLRWFISCAALAAVARRPVIEEARLLAPAWLYILVMAALGFTGFNALFYAAAHHTAAVNMAIIQGSTPIFVLLGTLLFLRTPFSLAQLLGVLVTIAGVLLTASRGDLAVLLGLSFNRGDLWMLIASIMYATYTVALRRRPKTSNLVFFVGVAAAACVTSLPLLFLEMAAGQALWPSAKGWLVLLYVGLFPSLLCQIFWIRGIELIGPNRASSWYNLVPVFGALLSTALLGESFFLYHALALALVLGGIFVAERGRIA
jgi:drug/metabolite transporter (DMT)-like permease